MVCVMSDYDEIRDYSVEVLKKFRESPAPDKELLDQLRTLPDELVEQYRDGNKGDRTVKKVVEERGLGKKEV